jgi:hypothetical protein
MIDEVAVQKIQRRIHQGAKNSIKNLENAPLAVRQLANMRLGTVKALQRLVGKIANNLPRRVMTQKGNQFLFKKNEFIQNTDL